jgi:hypothetical protein
VFNEPGFGSVNGGKGGQAYQRSRCAFAIRRRLLQESVWESQPSVSAGVDGTHNHRPHNDRPRHAAGGTHITRAQRITDPLVLESPR